MPKQWQPWRICHGMNVSNCTPNVTIVLRRVISILIALNTFNKSNQARLYVDWSTNVMVLVDRHSLVPLVVDCLVPLVVLNLDVISWRNRRQRRSFRLSKPSSQMTKTTMKKKTRTIRATEGVRAYPWIWTKYVSVCKSVHSPANHVGGVMYYLAS